MGDTTGSRPPPPATTTAAATTTNDENDGAGFNFAFEAAAAHADIPRIVIRPSSNPTQVREQNLRSVVQIAGPYTAECGGGGIGQGAEFPLARAQHPHYCHAARYT